MTTKAITSGASCTLLTSNTRVSTRCITVAVQMILTGAVLIFVVGFTHGAGGFLHNAAHDTRHAASFPCH